jgi:hypothetical protein
MVRKAKKSTKPVAVRTYLVTNSKTGDEKMINASSKAHAKNAVCEQLLQLNVRLASSEDVVRLTKAGVDIVNLKSSEDDAQEDVNAEQAE